MELCLCSASKPALGHGAGAAFVLAGQDTAGFAEGNKVRNSGRKGWWGSGAGRRQERQGKTRRRGRQRVLPAFPVYCGCLRQTWLGSRLRGEWGWMSCHQGLLITCATPSHPTPPASCLTTAARVFFLEADTAPPLVSFTPKSDVLTETRQHKSCPKIDT